MDAQSSFPQDSDRRPDWEFSLDDLPPAVELDPADVAAGREALRAMQRALLEAHRQSLVLDAAIASLVAQGAHSGHVAGLGLSGPTSELLVGGMSAYEWTCREGVAHFEGRPRPRSGD